MGVIVEVHPAVEHIRRGHEALLERIFPSPHVGQTIRIVGTRSKDGRLTGVVTAGLTGPDRELHTVRGRQRVQMWLLRSVPGVGRRYVTRAAAWYAEDPLKNHRRLLEQGQDTWMQPHEESNLEGARQGAAGLVGDWLATDLHRWGFHLRDVATRVLIWAGRHDPGRAVTDAATVAARLPNAEVRIAEDAAHTPSPEHWREMLTWVTRD